MNYTVGVRTLCAFAARRGDLDLRNTPSPTAAEGMEGHAAVRAQRPDYYETEVSVSGQYGGLCVRGRADGYDPVLNRLEEIKSHRGKLDTMPSAQRDLHWAQARVYGHLLCESRGLSSIELALVYFDVGTRRSTVYTETWEAPALASTFATLCEHFATWAEQEMQHRLARDGRLRELAFPFKSFRAGQRPLAVSVYRACRDGKQFMVQAPTGLGKTIGTLFPTFKAMPDSGVDRVFYLTARTSGRQLAIDATQRLFADARDGRPRVLELSSREHACEHPGQGCHPDACPLAAGFYDKLPAARSAAVQAKQLDRAALRDIALAHGCCPYWLGQEMVKWSDICVGDYNHYFDTSAVLYHTAQQQEWQCAVLVDEAHNLVERARAMYSAHLDTRAIMSARRHATTPLKRRISRLLKDCRETYEDQVGAYQDYPCPPAALIQSLQITTAYLGELSAAHPQDLHPDLLALYFDLLAFLKLAEAFGPHAMFDVQLTGGTSAQHPAAILSIRNVVPAPYLAPRHQASHSMLLFSATLAPADYYRDLLGLDGETSWQEFDPPFRAEQLDVQIIQGVSTRFRDRAQSLLPIASIMADQYRRQPGNYLSYFSSFEYLEQVIEQFQTIAPDIPVWQQARRMSETERAAFLARFHEPRIGIAFAVLGGVFSEGIDLPGDALIGAFVSTLGLPQFNPVNERMQSSMREIFGQHAYRYTYLYPGLQKVVQAAGRVIRTPEDEGVVILIDDRYNQPGIQALLPRWWQVGRKRATISEKNEH